MNAVFLADLDGIFSCGWVAISSAPVDSPDRESVLHNAGASQNSFSGHYSNCSNCTLESIDCRVWAQPVQFFPVGIRLAPICLKLARLHLSSMLRYNPCAYEQAAVPPECPCVPLRKIPQQRRCTRQLLGMVFTNVEISSEAARRSNFVQQIVNRANPCLGAFSGDFRAKWYIYARSVGPDNYELRRPTRLPSAEMRSSVEASPSFEGLSK